MEPIGAAASKEYSLEKNMEKMKMEWVNICFSFVKYRDTVSPPLFNSPGGDDDSDAFLIEVFDDRRGTELQ